MGIVVYGYCVYTLVYISIDNIAFPLLWIVVIYSLLYYINNLNNYDFNVSDFYENLL